ncbi:MAG: metallophosphoesterase, partial [Candidatus Altiarchaeota archaeon]
IHDQVVELGGVSFIGLGGSNPTPFGTPTEFSEEEIYAKLSKLFSEAKNEKIILLTHFPPKDTKCDRIPSGAHVGSESLWKIIAEKKPSACVCSHIHESGGEEDGIESTKIINLGMLSHGHAVIIETDPLSVEHVSFR